MKIPIKNSNLRMADGKNSPKVGVAMRCARAANPSLFAIRNSQFERGVALVVTLILLSVTLVMAVAFLALARRGRNAATTATDTTTARLAAEAALSAAEAQIAANLYALNTTNPYNFGLVVSTNYINWNGFAGGISNPTNVNYDYYNDAVHSPTFATDVDRIQNIANLFLLPRAPVFVQTNQSPYGYNFPFYLDLNRNGRFETNGWVAEFAGTGATNGNYIQEVGDPEWIGVLERPDTLHSPDNKFLARYAFVAQPIGNSLDVNYIHNQVLNQNLGLQDGYFRNQGIGSWELNLAAFLADLNTNQWGQAIGAPSSFYQYNEPAGFNNSGYAFEDARALLSYRYNYNYNNLASAGNYFANAGLAFPFDNIDECSDGPLQLTTTNINENLSGPADGDKNTGTTPWAGSDNPNKYFSLGDFFDPAKTSGGLNSFTNRLRSAGTNVSTYDRYTFYRMLDQLGTDSTPPSSGKMNLNYQNIVNGAVVPGMETNLYPWTAADFFTNAADLMLRYYTASWLTNNLNSDVFQAAFNTGAPFGITNIPVLVSNRFVYSPAVNRILQLAANMFDASTNSPFPSVFRPVFWVVNQNGFKDVYIDGYEYVSSVSGVADPVLNNVIDVTELVPGHDTRNVYGVPWIVGAKKGLPNFNQFYLLSAVQVERKLQVTRPAISAADPTPGLSEYRTNQMYVFSISNSLGCSLWNSYQSNYLGNLTVVARDNASVLLTNDALPAPGVLVKQFLPIATVAATNNWNWPGTIWAGDPSAPVLDAYNNSFVIPFNGTAVLLTNSIYRYAGYPNALPNGAPGFDPYNTDYQTNVNTPALPHFGLLTTNRLQVFILNTTNGVTHVIDYVHFAGPDNSRDLNAELADPSDPANNNHGLWTTNPITGGSPSGTTLGVVNQIAVSKGDIGVPNAGARWVAPPNLPNYLPQTPAAEQAWFKGFFNVSKLQYGLYRFNGKAYYNTNQTVQAPFTPLRMAYDYVAWQANDPLVHYLATDLNYTDPGVTGLHQSDDPTTALPPVLLNTLSKRWSPWGQAYPFGSSITGGAFLTQLKDPLVWQPDNWDFPTGKYPSVGWLGRIHRGTPWQTVYLKASDILTNAGVATGLSGPNAWVQWTGDTNAANGRYFDAMNSTPLQDGALFDLFTTALGDNATRGSLSINQSGLAAWSALFSGMVALSNSAPPVPYNGYLASPAVTNMIIQPAGVDGGNSLLGQLVASINAARAATNLFPLGAFTRSSDILRVSAFTEDSPFLNTIDPSGQDAYRKYHISDELYEWLPQQTIGLLRVGTPRYVVYCYGQALRPAANSRVTSGGQFFGLITNYSVVAESAARAVIRVDNAGTAKPHVVVESFNVLGPE